MSDLGTTFNFFQQEKEEKRLTVEKLGVPRQSEHLQCMRQRCYRVCETKLCLIFSRTLSEVEISIEMSEIVVV